MSETRATTPVFPPGRYGRRRDGRRRPPVGTIVVLAIVLIASGLIAIKLYQRYGQTDYQAQVVGWDKPTADRMTIHFTLSVPAGGAAVCHLRARDYGGNEVGSLDATVHAKPGETSIDVRVPVPTTKQASVGDITGCQAAN